MVSLFDILLTKVVVLTLDELGRSTSFMDAVPLCFSVSEYLLSLKGKGQIIDTL